VFGRKVLELNLWL